MSGTDDDALDSALVSCGICKEKIAPGEQTVSCGNCNYRFHIRCEGVDVAAQDGKWFCKEQICQIASMIEEEKLLALAEKIKNLEATQKIDLLLKQKERRMLHELEVKKLEEEEKMRAAEEEEETVLQEKMLQAKVEELARKEARRKSFDEKMANLDRKLQNLKIATGSGKTQETSKDADETDSEDEAQENPGKTNGSKDGLGQQGSGPTKAQLAARSGLTQELPSFSGNPEEWPLFYGAFQASNAACGYTNIENLVRLQGCLTGYARKMVCGQLQFPKTVPKAIAKLRMLFGRPELLLQVHLDKVRNLQPPRSDKLSSFIPFGNTVEQMCEHIEAADLHQHLINPLLIQELVDKLPDPEKRQWVRFKKRAKKVTLRTFTDFIMEIVEEACEANVALDFLSDEQCSSKAKEGCGAGCCHTEEEDRGTGSSEQKRLAPCKMCHSTEHRLRDCGDFRKLKYAERLQLVNEERLCNKCLNEHGGQCWFKFRCNVSDCREPHHPLMHPVETVVGVNAHICSGTDITFRMIPVQLHCGGRSHDVLAFLDEGSSVTLLDQKLADELELKGAPEPLTMQWTAGYQHEEMQSRRMNLSVSGVRGDKDGLLELHAVRTVQKLMLPRQKVDYNELAAKHRHLRGLPIDSYDGQPRLLIGLNNVHAFAPSEVKMGAALGPAPVAVLCKLGWSVYGPKPVTATHQVSLEDLDEVQHIEEKPKKKTKKSKQKPKQTGRNDGESKMSLEMNDLLSPKRRSERTVEAREQQWTEVEKSGSVKTSPSDDDLDGTKGVAEENRCCRVGFLVTSGFPTQTPVVTGWGVATRRATSVAKVSDHSPGRANCQYLNRADVTKEERKGKSKCKHCSLEDKFLSR